VPDPGSGKNNHLSCEDHFTVCLLPLEENLASFAQILKALIKRNAEEKYIAYRIFENFGNCSKVSVF
jgi:hypothetical protein